MSDNLLRAIDSKLDKIQEAITEVKITQARQEEVQNRHDENLREHMHRSDLLEESQEVLYEEVSNIKLRAAKMDGVLRFIGISSTVISAVVGLLKILHKI
jgi:hypothetical protein